MLNLFGQINRGHFAQTHWALWAGLLAFLSSQLSNKSDPLIALFCGFLAIFLVVWLVVKKILFFNFWISALCLIAPIPGFFKSPKIVVNDHKIEEVVGLFSLREVKSSVKDQIRLLGDLRITSKVKALEGAEVRIAIALNRHEADFKSGRWRVLGALYKKPFSEIWQFQLSKHQKLISQPTLMSQINASWIFWRYAAKAKVSHFITSCLPATRARHFILGLLTGQQSDLRLSHLLSRVGLSHLMAVSGFHFACILAASGIALRSLRLNHPAGLLIPLLVYFAYMGPSASVFRAAVMGICRIISQVANRPYFPLQALGLGLLLWCCLWPNSTGELGFLLSYLCTAALLLLMKPIQESLVFLYPSLKGDFENRFKANLSKFFNGALSANLSAHLATLAPQFYFWHFFSISSIFYNLLFPPLIGLFMPLLLIACASALIFPALGKLMLIVIHSMMTPLLRLTDVPRPWECLLWFECNGIIAAMITAGLLIGGLFFYEKSHNKNVSRLEKWIC